MPFYTEREAAQRKAATARYIQRKREYVDSLRSVPCMDCGVQYPLPCMEFDHRPGTVKLFCVSRYATVGMKALSKEIAKCDAVCSNCHKMRTYNRRHNIGQ